MEVVVVGAGLGGLSAACHLAGRGHDVLVLERGDVPGGRAGLWEEGGYRFDTGPSVLTMTGILERTFAAAGADMGDHLSLRRVDPMYRACFADGSELRVWHDRDRMTEEVRQLAGDGEARAFGRFCDWLTRLYQVEMPNFIDRDFDSPLDLAWPLGPLVRLVGMGGFRKLASVVGGHFSDPRLQRIFSFQSMYAGLSPFEALALYAVITYMDTVEGVWFPEGGLHAIPRGLQAAAEKAGATFRFGAEVESLVRPGYPARGAEVAGVRLVGGEVIGADAVVLNPDLPVAYQALLPDVRPPRAVRRGNYSPSCTLWLAGVSGRLPDGAAHHNIHFGARWEESFDDLLGRKVPMDDPSVLVSSPSVTDPGLAPPGRHTLYVLEPMPNLDGPVDWSSQRGPLKERLLATVAGLGYPVAPAEVEVERFTDPADWERAGLARGTPFSLAHDFFQTGPFRPGNVERAAPGVVFVGSGTVPGVGVPIVLLSGRLAADRVEELGRRSGRG